MLDLIICANFGVEKLRGLGNTRGQILEFPIEMAGHLYNRAGATAQPVISKLISHSLLPFYWQSLGIFKCDFTPLLAVRRNTAPHRTGPANHQKRPHWTSNLIKLNNPNPITLTLAPYPSVNGCLRDLYALDTRESRRSLWVRCGPVRCFVGPLIKA